MTPDTQLSLPPLLQARPLLAPDADALAAAVAACRGGGDEVGAVFAAASESRLSMAVVLGPEVAPRRCWEMLFLAAVAFGDSVGAIAPPELAVHFRWPDQIVINGAQAGRVRLAMSKELDADGAPLWLALGLDVAVRPEPDGPEPGVYLDRTTLFNEGAVDESVQDWAEAFTRHLLVWIHTWEESGFRRVHTNWWGRHDPKSERFSWQEEGGEMSGKPIGLDEHGSLLIQVGGETRLLEPERLLGPKGAAGPGDA